MKIYAVLVMLFALAASAVPLDKDSVLLDSACTVTWVTVTAGSTAASSTIQIAASSSTSIQSVTTARETSSTLSSSPSQPTSSNTTSALDLSDVSLPGGQPPFLINDDYVHAPQDNTPVPDDAAVYIPKTAGVFDCLDFSQWRDEQRDNPPTSKFLKIQPGAYRYKLGPPMSPGTDPNTVDGENIIMYLMKGGWTLDLRGVTFYVDITPQNYLQRPSVLIYTLQSDSLTILGGTIWQDFGELYTQARVTAISDDDVITFQVEQGYNLTRWREAGPRNQDCIDTSNPNNYTFPGCNFWKVDDYNFDNLDTQRTFTAQDIGGSAIAVGQVIVMMNGMNQFNTLFTLSNEANTGLQVKGMTTNGGFMSIGLDNGESPPTFIDCYTVNPPARPGFASRVMGPLIAWANVNLGAIYNEPDRPNAVFQNSYFQYTGNPKDLWDTSDLDRAPS
ncbi:MAG: hypothetical protein GOMPHAMPRED_000556 [Gomphillus americanus]|uniref:Uncharacterized protein n=1 Tax=Gomphillus americanus TaxID=1940652 RepID=A0A8H3EB56_9LECA|nr:MAG: hypothetical protein GOMPHAMPRED_000556 [Gomphillus americanus]